VEASVFGSSLRIAGYSSFAAADRQRATVVAVLANAERPRRLPALGFRLLCELPT
jgi:hypothetical protein